MCILVGMYTCECMCPQSPGWELDSLRATVTGSCECLDIALGSLTWVLYKNNMCSYLQNHFSSPYGPFWVKWASQWKKWNMPADFSPSALVSHGTAGSSFSFLHQPGVLPQLLLPDIPSVLWATSGGPASIIHLLLPPVFPLTEQNELCGYMCVVCEWDVLPTLP